MTPAARRALEDVMGERVEFDVPMARHTSLGVGGPADALAQPASRDELERLLSACANHALPHFVIGAGFNVLVRDAGIDGVVIRLKKLRNVELRGERHVYAEAGASHASVTRFCIEHGLAGLEFAAGIPGSVGGWISMNAGIGVRELKDVVHEIEIFDAEGKGPRRLARAELDFHYRDLVGLPEGAVLLSALLHVTPSAREAVQREVDRLLAQRSDTQPLNVPSCGSVFRNPDGGFAGQLVEQAGLKGERIGGAEISRVHANFIANTGGASAADVLRLIERARDRVLKSSGIELAIEVRVIGRIT
jgi:UDP-N-acetylmuramate dehydrogenase